LSSSFTDSEEQNDKIEPLNQEKTAKKSGKKKLEKKESKFDQHLNSLISFLSEAPEAPTEIVTESKDKGGKSSKKVNVDSALRWDGQGSDEDKNPVLNAKKRKTFAPMEIRKDIKKLES
jgi:hypothetical protein